MINQVYKIRSLIKFTATNSNRLCKFTISPFFSKQISTNGKKKTSATEIEDRPIKYTTSRARNWRAEYSRTGDVEPRLWYEPHVIIGSLTIFMVYFCILREENDIDEEFERSLYSRIDGLEEYQLKVSLAYNKEHNMDTEEITKRLEYLQEQRRQKDKETE